MPFPEADPGPSYQILQITFNFIICVSIVWENVFRVSAFASQHNKTVRGANTFGTSLHLIIFTCSPAEQEKKWEPKNIFLISKGSQKKENQNYDEFVKRAFYFGNLCIWWTFRRHGPEGSRIIQCPSWKSFFDSTFFAQHLSWPWVIEERPERQRKFKISQTLQRAKRCITTSVFNNFFIISFRGVFGERRNVFGRVFGWLLKWSFELKSDSI